MGLSASDFTVLDNGESRIVHVDESDGQLAPIALVVVVQATDFSWPAIAKLRKAAAMIPEAVIGANGEAAVIAFDKEVRVLQGFTRSPDAIAAALADFKPADAEGAHMIDAVADASEMLATRPGARRSTILLISEARDRGSKHKLSEVVSNMQRSGITIYGLTYSAYATAFTTKSKDYTPPDMVESPDMRDSVPIAGIFSEIAHQAKKNTAATLAQVTGGRVMNFETKSRLENDLIKLGADIHSRYLISFTPKEDAKPSFHKLEIKVRDRPNASVKAREGYWAGTESAQRH
jgi:VWFA-related protein